MIVVNNSAFEVAPFLDIKETIASGYVMYAAKIAGFWSKDTVVLNVRRCHSDNGTWNATISVGSGGRDTTAVRSDTDAYLNYAKALEFLTKFGKSLEQEEWLEQTYQDHKKQKELEEIQYKEANPALGEAGAALLMEKLKNDPTITVTLRVRQPDGFKSQVHAKKSDHGAVRYYFNGYNVNRARLVTLIKDLSANVIARNNEGEVDLGLV